MYLTSEGCLEAVRFAGHQRPAAADDYILANSRVRPSRFNTPRVPYQNVVVRALELVESLLGTVLLRRCLLALSAGASYQP